MVSNLTSPSPSPSPSLSPSPVTMSASQHLDFIINLKNDSNYEEALQHGKQAYQLLKAQTGETSVKTIDALSCVMYCYSHLGRYQEALDTNVVIQRLCRESESDDRSGIVDVVYWKVEHAVLYMKWRKFDEAVKELTDVLSEGKTVEVGVMRASVYVYLGMSLCGLGKVEEGKKKFVLGSNVLFRLMLEDVEEYYQTRTASVFHELGEFYESIGEARLAVNVYERSLVIVEKLVRGELRLHPWMLKLGKRIGELWVEEGNEEKAVLFFKKAVEMLEMEVKDGAKYLEYELMCAYKCLGVAYAGRLGKKDVATARKVLLKGKAIADASFSLEDGVAREIYIWLGNTYIALGRCSQAVNFYKTVIRAYEIQGVGEADARVRAVRELLRVIER